jgi:hypothetical protein
MELAVEKPVSKWQRRKVRFRQLALGVRDELRRVMGNVCKKCGALENLTFHHPHGRTWEPRDCNVQQRMRYYKRDFEAGLLELWCNTCNGRDGATNASFYRERKKEVE